MAVVEADPGAGAQRIPLDHPDGLPRPVLPASGVLWVLGGGTVTDFHGIRNPECTVAHASSPRHRHPGGAGQGAGAARYGAGAQRAPGRSKPRLETGPVATAFALGLPLRRPQHQHGPIGSDPLLQAVGGIGAEGPAGVRREPPRGTCSGGVPACGHSPRRHPSGRTPNDRT